MIRVENLYFAYSGNPVLADVSFSVSGGEFIAVIGANGAGKSSLLKILDRILEPGRGGVTVLGKELQSYSRRALAKAVGFVPQQFSSTFNFSARDIVLMGRFAHQNIFGGESAGDLKIVEKAMRATDCYSLGHRSFFTLSGGEQKRVVLASALAQEPKILLLDEPDTALDLRHRVHFYRILKKLQQKENLTILSVTHDVNLAARFCGRILALKNGKIIADDMVDKVLKKNVLEEVYDTRIEILSHPQNGLPIILAV